MLHVAHLSVALAGMLCLPLAPAAHAQDTEKSRIAIIGSADVSLYGQDGYCGSMTSYDKSNIGGVLIDARKRTWFRLKHQRDCVGDFSFIPQPGQAYIFRAGTADHPCLAEFFRVNPGRQPSREPLHTEEKRSCLLPWNHGANQESAASSVGPAGGSR